MVELLVKRLDPGLPLPAYAHEGDAGLDLYAAEDVSLEPLQRALVPTGIAVAIPEGYAGFVQPRSGLANRNGLSFVNTPGLIDAHYRGEIKVIAINLDPERDPQPFSRRANRSTRGSACGSRRRSSTSRNSTRRCEVRVALAAAESELRPRIRVAALIVARRKVVLTRHLKDGQRYHLLPGGGVGYGETLEEAARPRGRRGDRARWSTSADRCCISDTIDPDGTRHSVNIVFLAEASAAQVTDQPADPRVEAVDLVEPDGSASRSTSVRRSRTQWSRCFATREAATARYLGSLFTP